MGAEDAEFLEKELFPEFVANDLVNLPKYSIYLKLMIDGITARPFSARTLDPYPKPVESFKDVIIENTRSRFGTPRLEVEKTIAGEWGTTGGEAMEERIHRRDEQSLERTLRRTPSADFPRQSFPRQSSGQAGQAGQASPTEEPAFRPRPQGYFRPPVEKKQINIESLKESLEKALHDREEPKE